VYAAIQAARKAQPQAKAVGPIPVREGR
jgi:hypothetical protein